MSRRSLECLLDDVAFALREGLGPSDLIPMLERLLELAPAGSDASQFGQLQLAELMIAKQPFRAASLARSVARRCSSDRAWGVVGLAMTVLGHYRAAVKAFRRAISHSPHHAGHLHNLGHVLDIGLGRPRDAVKYLDLAHRLEPTIEEISSSLSHALALTGQVRQAVAILRDCVGMNDRLAVSSVEVWLSPSKSE